MENNNSGNEYKWKLLWKIKDCLERRKKVSKLSTWRIENIFIWNPIDTVKSALFLYKEKISFPEKEDWEIENFPLDYDALEIQSASIELGLDQIIFDPYSQIDVLNELSNVLLQVCSDEKGFHIEERMMKSIKTRKDALTCLLLKLNENLDNTKKIAI